jgi:hypothetical protein
VHHAVILLHANDGYIARNSAWRGALHETYLRFLIFARLGFVAR